MKNRIVPRPVLIIAGTALMVVSAVELAAQNSSTSNTTPNVTETTVASQTSPVQLSYGVPEILKLPRARVSDDTIVAFIENSGRIYSLSAPEIVYLREEGVSDRVVTAMLNQRKKVTEAAAQTAPQASAPPAAPPPSYADANSAQSATAVAQPSTTYVETSPAYVPPSTVYIMPYPSATYAYYGYYPYYGGYYGYYYPAVSFSFGFRSGSRGGFHGGISHFGHRH